MQESRKKPADLKDLGHLFRRTWRQRKETQAGGMEDSRWRPSYLNPNQDAILGQLKACGEHRLQESWINILSETGYLEGNTHTQGAVKALLNHPPKTGTCVSAPTSPVEAISQRSTGSASLKRGQENMGAWWKQGHREQVFSTCAATEHRNMWRAAVVSVRWRCGR